MKILIVGNGGREHALAWKLRRDAPTAKLFATRPNPGLARLATGVDLAPTDIDGLTSWAEGAEPALTVIGPEVPLALGLGDALRERGFPVFGPSASAARIESSKTFAKELMVRAGVPTAAHRTFTSWPEAEAYLSEVGGPIVVKASGLAAGKGAIVCPSTAEALAAAKTMLMEGAFGPAGCEIVVEEFMDGEELSVFALTDGCDTVLMLPSQDYKRIGEGDTGPNTGGMGSYSQADGLLPFLSQAGYDTALDIVRKVVQAVKEEGAEYKGILYGQFMLTPAGVKLVEFNARLGDPEAINVIPLLQTGLADICAAIMSGSLDKLSIGFDAKAAVCKYVVPPDYGMEPKVGVPIRVDSDKIASLGAQVFYARVNRDGNRLLTTMSRSVAILGLGESITQAEYMVEQALQHVHGDFYVRRDIGKLAGPSPHTARDRR